MKKSIPQLLLVACFLLFGIKNVSAATGPNLTIANISNTSAVVAGNTLSQSNAVLYAFSVANTNATATEWGSFSFTCSGATAPSAATASISLYYQTAGTGGATFNINTAALTYSVTAPATAGSTITFSNLYNYLNNLTKSTTGYFFLVENFSVPTVPPGSISYALQTNAVAYNGAGTAFAAFTYPTTAQLAGNVYTWTQATTVQFAAFTTPGSNGLTATPLLSGQNNIVLYGFSLTAGAGNAAASISLAFYLSSAGSNYQDYTTMTLYSCSTNNYTTGTTNAISTYTATNTGTSTDYYATFPALTVTPGSGTTFYFLVINSISGASNNSIEEDLSKTNCTGTFTTTGSTTGYNYPINNPKTYYWWGAGATTDWKNPNNWTTSQSGYSNSANSYPGASPTDIAIFSYDYWQSFSDTQSPTIGAYNITIGGLTVTSISGYSNVLLTVNSAYSLTTGNLTETDPGNITTYTNLSILGSATGVSTPLLQVTGLTSLSYACSLTASTNGNITLPSGSSTALANAVAGGTFYPGTIAVAGGTFVANSSAIAFATGTNYGGSITVTSGSCTINGGSVTMAGVYPQIKVSGGIFTANNCPFTLSGTSPQLLNSGTGQFNYYGNTINITGTQTTNPMGMTVSGGVVRIGGTTLANASTVNLGTTTSNGTNSIISSTGGNLYLGSNSVVNLLGPTTTFSNTAGVVVCASTSFINPTSTSATISNSNVAANSNFFTLLSDASGSATIGQLGVGAKVTGQFNVQRYISDASRNYRLLSSATNSTAYTPGSTGSPNQVNLSLIGKSATVPTTTPTTYPGAFTGGPAGTGGGFTATTGGPTMYLYQESIVPSLTNYNASYYSGKNIAITSLIPTYETTVSTANAVGGTGAIGADNSSTVIVGPGNGYLLFYIHDNSTNVATTPINTTQTTASGFINQGTIPLVLWGQSGFLTKSLTNNGVSPATNPHALAGFTMVGNPYPSTIDLQQLYKDNISASSVFTNGAIEYFNTLDPTNTQFVSYGYDGTNVYTSSGTNFSRYIASGEGFYITVQKANQGLTFYEDQKTATAPSVVVENIPGTNPANTVDNVNIGSSKIADAAILPIISSTGSNGFGASFAGNQKTANVFNTPLKPNDLAVVNNTAIATLTKPKVGTTTIFSVTGTSTGITPGGTIVNNLPAPANTPPPTISSTGTPVTLTDLHLKLVMDSVDYDECGLYFSKTGLDKYEANDALDLDGTSGKVYLSSYTSDNLRTGINSLGDYTPGKRVNLYVRFSADGIYQLQLEDLKGFNTNQYSIFLIDNLKKDSLDLTLYKSYNFNYAVSDTASYHTRFVLAIEHKPVPYYALTAFAGEKVTSGVQLSWSTKNESNTTKFVLQKLTGTNTYTFLDSLSSDSSGTYAYVDAHPTLGNNIYRLQQTDGLGNVTYSAPITIGYNSTSPNGGLVVYPNPTKSTMTVTLNTSSITSQVATADIYDIHGTRVEHKSVNSNSFVYDASSYKLGVYIIELKNSNGVLVGKSKFVKVQ